MAPLLWLLHFNDLRAAARREVAGWTGHLADVRALDVYFADDVTLCLAHPSPAVLAQAAVRLSVLLAGELRRLGLELGRPKCRNLVMSPGRMRGYVYRRQTGPSASYRQGLKRNDELLERRTCPAEELGDVPEDVFPVAMRASLPYVYSDPLRILGAPWDGRMCFMDHISGVLDRANVRHGVMARLAHSTWGLEVGVLRATHAALLVSLSGYGLVVYGSGAYEVGLKRLEVQLANVSARRITGIGRSARLAALHMTADVLSVRNQYLKVCALTLDRALRAYNSTICDRMQAWLSAVLQVEEWRPAVARVELMKDAIPFIGLLEGRVCRVREVWTASLLQQQPQIPYRFLVESTYHSAVELTREEIAEGGRVYDFEEAGDWFDVGLQVLLASSWRPDCVVSEGQSILRERPLRTNDTCTFGFGSPHAVRWLGAAAVGRFTEALEQAADVLSVEACSFFEEGIGHTCAALWHPEAGARF